jgi:hypothetical protein
MTSFFFCTLLVAWTSVAGESAPRPLEGATLAADSLVSVAALPADRVNSVSARAGDNDTRDPVGACCLTTGACVITTENNCVFPNFGEWLGAGTSCDPNPCADLPGACCLPNGGCETSLPLHCDFLLNGVWMGWGVPCTPNPCEYGACCWTFSCTVTRRGDCHYSWSGPGTTCDANPCADGYGVCCLPDGGCTHTYHLECVNVLRGTWIPESACWMSPCPTPKPCCQPDGTCAFISPLLCQGQIVYGATACGADCNNNGVDDVCDIAHGTSQDCNNNGVPDECEWHDCNSNGVLDACDIATGTSQDCNHNGTPDECDIGSGYALDCNHNGIPDECEFGGTADCNSNGVSDLCDIYNHTSLDCDSNGVPDECEWHDCNFNGVLDACDIALGTSRDCNNNGIPDECDLLGGLSLDCNSNGIPDECEPDCNQNGIPDACDIANHTSQDCNGNGIPDECDLASSTSHDCNTNGIPDECDIVAGHSLDCNSNGIPDECDLASGMSHDCNSNGILDECDIANHTSPDCNGNGIPDECDAASCDGSPWCSDCNSNGVIDVCDLLAGSAEFHAESAQLSPLLYPTTQSYTIVAAPSAISDVLLSFVAQSDINGTDEHVYVDINGTSVGTVYGAPHAPMFFQCAANQQDTITVPMATYNTARAAGGGNVTIHTVPQTGVNTPCAGGNYIQIAITYNRASGSADQNGNGIPDECERGACCLADQGCEVRFSTDCAAAGGTYKGNHTTCDPSPCSPTLCAGDTNCDGRVTFADIDLFVAALSGESAWTHVPCPWLNADCNGDNNVTFADIDPFVTLLGTTCP